jgi:hypothetical protein
MNRRELEQAIRDEVEEWPGVSVEFAEGGRHPKAKLTFTPPDGEPLMLSRPYPSTPGTQGLRSVLGDMRRVMKQLGAARSKPEPSAEETEKRYSKPNPGADLRPNPVEGEKATPKADVADQLVAAGAATPEAAAAAKAAKAPAIVYVPDDGESDEDAEREAALAALQAAVDAIEDGVYFGLPAEVYHAVPRLSASGLQRLCVSPATFWKGSWLDPERPELDEEETKAQQLGKAYHVARLEPDRFHATYVREIDKADFPSKGFLSSDEKVKAALKAMGQQQTITGESTAERAQRLLDCGYEGTVFPLEKAKWAETVQGRIPLPAKHFDQIATDMERIRTNGEIADLLTGGEAEVSVFWTDRHGLKCKARFDYLTTAWWDDFKTFDNSRGKELEQAIVDAVRYNRYHVQAVHYRDAAEAIRTGSLPVNGEATDAQLAMVAAIQIRPDELACWYIFQEKGGVPNLLAYEFPFVGVGTYRETEIGIMVEGEDEQAKVRAAMGSATMLHRKAAYEIDRAKRAFVLYSEVYEPGRPWFPIEARRRLDDLDFNQHWLEGR